MKNHKNHSRNKCDRRRLPAKRGLGVQDETPPFIKETEDDPPPEVKGASLENRLFPRSQNALIFQETNGVTRQHLVCVIMQLSVYETLPQGIIKNGNTVKYNENGPEL